MNTLDNYNIVNQALGELIRIAYLTKRCYVKFRIEPKNDYHFYDPSLCPSVIVSVNTGEEGYIVDDFTLSISLFLDGFHENESKELFELLNNSKLKSYFKDFPEKFAYGPFYANVGKDFKVIAGLVIQILYTLSKCQDIEVTPEFNAFWEIPHKEKLENLILNPTEVSLAVKNAFEKGLSLIDITSIRMDILRERIEGYDYLGDVGINNENEGEYLAYITIAPIKNRSLDLIIRDLKQNYGLQFLEGCHIMRNTFELRMTFQKDKKEYFLQFITDLFRIFYPSLKPNDIAAKLTYDNFISKPTLFLQYLFHSDGSGPSETELKYGRLLIENLEVEEDEDELYDHMDD